MAFVVVEVIVSNAYNCRPRVKGQLTLTAQLGRRLEGKWKPFSVLHKLVHVESVARVDVQHCFLMFGEFVVHDVCFHEEQWCRVDGVQAIADETIVTDGEVAYTGDHLHLQNARSWNAAVIQNGLLQLLAEQI